MPFYRVCIGKTAGYGIFLHLGGRLLKREECAKTGMGREYRTEKQTFATKIQATRPAGEQS